MSESKAKVPVRRYEGDFELPGNMRLLRRDKAGRPVPFFVYWPDDGEPDFRIIAPGALVKAFREELCWVCGVRLNRVRNGPGPRGTFVAGPMCLVNRTSAEPPSHDECADASARICPFMANPEKVRREANLPAPEDTMEMPGIAIMRNPGVTALISSQRWDVFGDGRGGALFRIGRIQGVRWYAYGRDAEAETVLQAVDSGLPALIAEADRQPGARIALGRCVRDALRWTPRGASSADYANITAALAAQ